MASLREKTENFLHKLTGRKEEGIPFNTSAKVMKLLELVHLGDVGFRADQYGPYALVPFPLGGYKNRVLIVRDIDKPEDGAQISARVDELKMNKEYKDVEFEGVDPRRFLAQVVTQGLYTGFHDKMGFAVMSFTGLLDIFGNPSSRKIDRVLEKSGFQNIGNDN